MYDSKSTAVKTHFQNPFFHLQVLTSETSRDPRHHQPHRLFSINQSWELHQQSVCCYNLCRFCTRLCIRVFVCMYTNTPPRWLLPFNFHFSPFISINFSQSKRARSMLSRLFVLIFFFCCHFSSPTRTGRPSCFDGWKGQVSTKR